MITTRLFLIIALLFSPKIPLLGQEEPNSLHIRKDTPLSENKIGISSDTNTSNYWMNTPLKKE